MRITIHGFVLCVSADRSFFAQRKTKFSYAPKFSVVVPLYHTPAKFLKDLVRSMMYQSYANWELCLVNASPEDVHLTSLLENWAMRDKRIRVIRLEKKSWNCTKHKCWYCRINR